MPLAVVAREARPCMHACITKPSPSQECTTAHQHAFPLSLFPFLPPALALPFNNAAILRPV
ncbi:hypothetical protein CCUS01_01590 [Colletotrichum cuscutae]|uniref:Uncharacterized protein n=1 Tax=Colletotrichum cuscutae TaxID=1209917 RepID=A0AAI9URH0_9PEZI|nr:hypothetical protein CCUS01_01590 [Colletotrichum cuscutae]